MHACSRKCEGTTNKNSYHSKNVSKCSVALKATQSADPIVAGTDTKFLDSYDDFYAKKKFDEKLSKSGVPATMGDQNAALDPPSLSPGSARL